MAWLIGARAKGAAWWWMAGAFAVSWVADTAAHWVSPWLVSATYPVSQASLVGAVLLTRREAVVFSGTLTFVAIAAALWGWTPDVFLHTVAWAGVVGIALRATPFRWSLLVMFGGGLLAWWWYVLDPGWAGWIGLQVARAVGIVVFCYASVHPSPRLRVL